MIYRVCRRSTDAQIARRRTPNCPARARRECGGSIFVKDISSIQINRYTQRKEYGFNQSSA
jgi:hypothetical protein